MQKVLGSVFIAVGLLGWWLSEGTHVAYGHLLFLLSVVVLSTGIVMSSRCQTEV